MMSDPTNSDELTWLRIDETEDAVDNIEMVHHFLVQLHGPIRWKWAILSLHQALYGFAVGATKPSDSSLALKKPEDPESQLISIWTALDRAKDPDWMPRIDWNPLVTSTAEDEAIDKIVNEFRNEFAHFRPQGWSIEVSGMPSLFIHVLRVIRHLALDSNTILFIPDELRDRTERALSRLDTLLEESVNRSGT